MALDPGIPTALAAAVPGIIAGVGGILVARNARTAIRQKSEADYVLLTAQAAELVTERIAEVKADHARCQRNIARLRSALIQSGIDVPYLE